MLPVLRILYFWSTQGGGLPDMAALSATILSKPSLAGRSHMLLSLRLAQSMAMNRGFRPSDCLASIVQHDVLRAQYCGFLMWPYTLPASIACHDFRVVNHRQLTDTGTVFGQGSGLQAIELRFICSQFSAASLERAASVVVYLIWLHSLPPSRASGRCKKVACGLIFAMRTGNGHKSGL